MKAPGTPVERGFIACDICGAVVDRIHFALHRGKKRCAAIKQVAQLEREGWRCVDTQATGTLVSYAKAPKKKAPRPIFVHGKALRDGSSQGTWTKQWVLMLVGLYDKEKLMYHDRKKRLKRAIEDEEYRKAQVALAACLGVSA